MVTGDWTRSTLWRRALRRIWWTRMCGRPSASYRAQSGMSDEGRYVLINSPLVALRACTLQSTRHRTAQTGSFA